MGNRLMSLKKRKKRKKEGAKYTVEWDDDLTEFPLDEGKTMLDYCPIRCSICLMGILKSEARCGPCVTHVFHSSCLTRWEMYQLQTGEQMKCPNCQTVDMSKYIKEDEPSMKCES